MQSILFAGNALHTRCLLHQSILSLAMPHPPPFRFSILYTSSINNTLALPVFLQVQASIDQQSRQQVGDDRLTDRQTHK
jgi:hypothetical protein